MYPPLLKNPTAIAANLDAIGAELRQCLAPRRPAIDVYMAVEKLPFAEVVEALRLRALHNESECFHAAMPDSANAWNDVAAWLDDTAAVVARAAQCEGDRL
jgi:hypothetical protein